MTEANASVQERETFIEGILSNMSLEQKVGQCFTIHWGGSMITPYVVEAIEKLHIGGLRVTPFGTKLEKGGKHYHQSLSYDFEYPPGYKKIKQNLFIPGSGVYVSPEQYAQRLNKLQKIACSRNPGVPLHISIDQEGDISRDFSYAGINLFPSAMGLTATGDPDIAYQACKAVAKQLIAIGMTNIHSPVLDVNMNPQILKSISGPMETIRPSSPNTPWLRSRGIWTAGWCRLRNIFPAAATPISTPITPCPTCEEIENGWTRSNCTPTKC